VVEGDGAALSVNVDPAILATETLHLESPEKVMTDDAPRRVDIRLRLEFVGLVVGRERNRWLFGTLVNIFRDLHND
jgi:hypothetical protein